VYADEEPKGKKRSNMMYLLWKLMEVCDLLERGMSTPVIECCYGVNESTIF
jgi:hypothetical protein